MRKDKFEALMLENKDMAIGEVFVYALQAGKISFKEYDTCLIVYKNFWTVSYAQAF